MILSSLLPTLNNQSLITDYVLCMPGIKKHRILLLSLTFLIHKKISFLLTQHMIPFNSLSLVVILLNKFRKHSLKIKKIFFPQNCSDGFKLSMAYKIYHIQTVIVTDRFICIIAIVFVNGVIVNQQENQKTLPVLNC